jgi:CheY-like chemotaxis protein
MTAAVAPMVRGPVTVKRVLLAEDDPVMQRAGAAALSRRGYSVTVAEDGAKALALASTQKPDLVLLDLLMPLMDGLEVLRALRADAETRSLPVVILSNSSRDLERRIAAELGVVDYLIKADLSLKALGDRVDAFFASPP